jgi:hypothetical protein
MQYEPPQGKHLQARFIPMQAAFEEKAPRTPVGFSQ